METRVGICSPAHIGLQLDKIPPGAFLQRIKHHLDINLAGEERGMKKEGAWASGGCLAHVAPGKPGVHAHGEGERVIALESW